MKTLHLTLRAETLATLNKLADFTGDSLGDTVAQTLESLAAVIVDFHACRYALVEDDLDVPEDLAGTVDALNTLLCHAQTLGRIIPHEFLGLAPMVARFDVLSRIEDLRAQPAATAAIWTPEGTA